MRPKKQGILEGTFNFEAFREANLLLSHLGMVKGRYDMRALIQFPSYPKCKQRPLKVALKQVTSIYCAENEFNFTSEH